jgi:hypothetical protein
MRIVQEIFDQVAYYAHLLPMSRSRKSVLTERTHLTINEAVKQIGEEYVKQKGERSLSHLVERLLEAHLNHEWGNAVSTRKAEIERAVSADTKSIKKAHKSGRTAKIPSSHA